MSPPDSPTSPSAWPPDNAVTGHHWLMDLSHCQAEPVLLNEAAHLSARLIDAAQQSGMVVLDHAFHQFAPAGVTGVVVLSESHVSVHTWPESRFVALDVYVCDHHAVNQAKGHALARTLKALFQAEIVSERYVPRRSAQPQA